MASNIRIRAKIQFFKSDFLNKLFEVWILLMISKKSSLEVLSIRLSSPLFKWNENTGEKWLLFDEENLGLRKEKQSSIFFIWLQDFIEGEIRPLAVSKAARQIQYRC